MHLHAEVGDGAQAPRGGGLGEIDAEAKPEVADLARWSGACLNCMIVVITVAGVAGVVVVVVCAYGGGGINGKVQASSSKTNSKS